jgi:hypothetical protein
VSPDAALKFIHGLTHKYSCSGKRCNDRRARASRGKSGGERVGRFRITFVVVSSRQRRQTNASDNVIVHCLIAMIIILFSPSHLNTSGWRESAFDHHSIIGDGHKEIVVNGTLTTRPYVDWLPVGLLLEDLGREVAWCAGETCWAQKCRRDQFSKHDND